MSGGLVDKVYIGLDNAPAAFDIKGRILGANGTNLEYIRSETTVVAVLKGDKYEPLHLALHHTRSEALAAARSLALNLIETIRAELAQWTAAQQSGTALPSLNVPPPSLTTTASAAPVAPPPPVTVTLSNSTTLTTSVHPTIISPVVTMASNPAPLMTVRQPTVLQLLPPQQQYVLNQENGQLIPIVQPGVQVPNSNFTSLPLAQSLSSLQQPNFGGTQIVDISNVQPVNVTQFRLGGVPSSMSMILPNGLTIPNANLSGGSDTTTVSSATPTPVVCAAQSTNSAQKILYSTDKNEKTDLKYHIQGADTVQWTVPGAQTMLIPYQQFQDLTSNQTGLTNLQPQQYVSIAPAGGLQQTTSLPLTAAQLQQLQASGAIMQLNQKPTVSSASLINIISTGQASSPQIVSASTPTKNSIQSGNHESRGQKRLSDGTLSQLQLRPIAPAGSLQDKNSRESRSGVWTGAVRENVAASMSMKINPAHGTIIHVSSGQQTSVSATAGTPEAQGQMFIRQIDRNSIQIQGNKDGQKQDLTAGKIQTAAQNVQMITVPPGMTVLQNPLSIGQMPTVLGQPNSHVYMIPTNQHNIVQTGGLPPGLIGQQVLQSGQNVTVMQPNQLGVPNNVQYNTLPLMSMNMAQNAQYMQTGINLNNQLTAQQLNAALANQQLANQNLAVSGTIPILQTNPPGSPLTNMSQTISVSQSTPLQQMMQQTSTYVTPGQTIQNPSITPQYLMQPNSTALTIQNTPGLQYNVQSNQTSSPQTNIANNTNTQTAASTESESSSNSSNSNTSNQSFISSSSQQQAYSIAGTQAVQNPTQQTYTSDNGTSQNASGFTSTNHSNGTQQNFNTNTNVANQTAVQSPGVQSNYTNASNPPSVNQNTYAASAGQNSQSVQQTNFSPSTTPAPQNQSGTYTTTNLVNVPNASVPQTFTQNQQNPYPNATGQNMAAYANNQYQYNNRPWFRAPRFGSPQGPMYTSNNVPPPNGPPMPVPAPSANYNYWQDS